MVGVSCVLRECGDTRSAPHSCVCIYLFYLSMSIRYASEYVDLLKANRMVSQHGHLYLVFASYGRYVEIIRKNH